MTRLLQMLRRHPATASLVVLVVAASVAAEAATASGSAPTTWGVNMRALEEGRGLFAVATSLVIAAGWGDLVFAVIGIVVLVGAAERAMGWRRTLVAFGVTGCAGALGGAALETLGLIAGQGWGGRFSETPVLDPLTGAVGAFFTASAFADQLWRRRFRVIGFAALAVFLLYVGTPAAAARLTAAFAGLAYGLLSTPARRAPFRVPLSSHHETRLLLGVLTLLVAFGPLLAVPSRHPQGPAHLLGVALAGASAGPDACAAGVATASCLAAIAETRMTEPVPVLLALLPLAVLALAGWALLRGRRAGVWLAAVVLILSGVLTLITSVLVPMLVDPPVGARLSAVPTPTPTETLLASIVPLVLGVVLLAARRHFSVRSTIRARAVFLVALGVALSIAMLVGATAWRLTRPLAPGEFWAWLVESLVPTGYLAQRLPALVGGETVLAVGGWVGALVWLCTLSAAVFLVVDTPAREGTSDRTRFRMMLRSGSTGSIAHMALWPGNFYWFSSDDRAAVAYRVVGDVALTVGGPVGACTPDQAVRGFAEFCDERGWVPAFYSVDARDAAVFDELGWSRADVGDDAVIDPGTFSLAGGRWKDIRTSINRASKTGTRAVWTSWAALDHGERNQVRVVSEEWMAGRSLPEMGFTLGGVDEAADTDVRLMLALSDTGTVLAVTSWLPTWRDGRVVGRTLDLMRRRSGSMNGVVEFLIAETVFRARDDGLDFVSLSAAPLAGVGEPGRGSGVAEQVLAYLAARLETLYGFRSLLAFKQKFGPELRPLVVAYPDPLALPAVAMALTRSYLPRMSLRQKLSLARSVVVGVVGPRPAPDPVAAQRASSS